MPKPDVSKERIPQILNAAAHAFSRNSIDGASISEIAKIANISKASIYHYFKSKDELVVALGRQVFEVDKLGMRHISTSNSTACKKIEKYITGLKELLYDQEHLLPVLAEFKVISMKNPVIKNMLSSYFTFYIEEFSQIIKEGIGNLEFRNDFDPEIAALTLCSIIEGSIILNIGKEKNIVNSLEKTVNFYIQSIKK